MFKINKKQKARGSHAGATWHARPRGRDTRTRAAPTWRDIHLFIYLLYIIRFFCLPYMGGLLTLEIVGCYKPDDLFFFFQCGTNPHFTYLSGDVDACGALDRAAREISCVDRVGVVHGSEINARVLKALL